MAIFDFTEEAELQGQAVEILKKIHKTKAGKAMIHTERCLTDSDGYPFACPLCGAEVDYAGRVTVPEKRERRRI